MPSDVHLTLAYLTPGEVRRIGTTLRSDPSDTSPGWYLRMYRNEGYDDIVKYTHVLACDIEPFARALQTALERVGQAGPAVCGAQALRNQSIEHVREMEVRKQRLERQIEEAKADLDRLAKERAQYGA